LARPQLLQQQVGLWLVCGRQRLQGERNLQVWIATGVGSQVIGDGVDISNGPTGGT
jgi:hypothetical protein